MQAAGGRARVNIVLSAGAHESRGFLRSSRITRDPRTTLFFIRLDLPCDFLRFIREIIFEKEVHSNLNIFLNQRERRRLNFFLLFLIKMEFRCSIAVCGKILVTSHPEVPLVLN